jgi:predicted RecB family endonuclease
LFEISCLLQVVGTHPISRENLLQDVIVISFDHRQLLYNLINDMCVYIMINILQLLHDLTLLLLEVLQFLIVIAEDVFDFLKGVEIGITQNTIKILL